MKQLIPLLLLGLTAGPVSHAAHAASASQMKTCKMAVLEKKKFRNLPMAAVSVRPGNKPNKVHFSVHWEGVRAEGFCKVEGPHHVKKVKITRYDRKHGQRQPHNEVDGFYYDRRTGKWRDSRGRICHTCTPENGFPAHGKPSYNQSMDAKQPPTPQEILNELGKEDL